MSCEQNQKLILRALRQILTGQDLEKTDVIQDIDAELQPGDEAEPAAPANRAKHETVSVSRAVLIEVLNHLDRLQPTNTAAVALRTELYR